MTATSVRQPVSLLLVSASYPPVLGGSEIEAQRVCAGLLRRGHSVTVLCAGGPPMPGVSRWVDPFGVPVRIFGGRWKGRLRDCAFALGVAWTLFTERRGCRLVYFLMQGLHLAAGLPVAHFLGKPVVMKVSGSSIITLMRGSRLGRLELRWLRRWAYRVMVLNPGMAEEAADAGLEPRHLLWMPNPVDTADFAPCGPLARRELRERLGMAADSLAIVFAGRLAPEKELPSLIDAAASVSTHVPGMLLVLVGDGPMRKGLEDRARRLGLGSQIRFTGVQTSAEVRQWLQAADVFALVSSNEGFSCSLAEAMAVGLPSVVSDIPANLQLIEDGVHGLRAAMGDRASIAAALLRLFGDEALRARLGAAARRRVLEEYGLDKILDRYEALFEEALRGSANKQVTEKAPIRTPL